MDSQLQQLIDRYLSASATAEEVQQLDVLLREDPAARQALTMASALDWQLRTLLASTASIEPMPAAKIPSAWSKPRWLAAAALLLAVGGWSAALYYAGLYRAKSQECAAALERAIALSTAATAAKPADPESARPGGVPPEAAPTDPAPPAPAPADRPPIQLADTRGLVLMLPDGQNQIERVFAGAPVPAGRSLWTCPWGGAGIRCPDGVSLQLDRNTVVVFSEVNGVRHAAVHSGIFYVTANRDQDGGKISGKFVVTTKHGSTVVEDAQAAVAADDERTIVEAAVGTVQVTRRSDGRTISIPAKHYAVVTDTDELKVIAGPFAWRQHSGVNVQE